MQMKASFALKPRATISRDFLFSLFFPFFPYFFFFKPTAGAARRN